MRRGRIILENVLDPNLHSKTMLEDAFFMRLDYQNKQTQINRLKMYRRRTEWIRTQR